MAYTSKPWTIEEEPKNLKEFKKEAQMKELAKRNKVVQPVTVARIVEFLDKNKNKTFTNAEIAAAVRVRSVSGIMDKLEEIGAVKVVKIRKGITSRIFQVYQSGIGNLNRIEKERMAEGDIAQILSVFMEGTNKIYTKKELSEITGISKNKVSMSLPILLVAKKIKIVGIEDGALTYQSIKGSKRSVEISTEPSPNYITLKGYLKMNNICGNAEEIKTSVNKGKGHSRLFYSDKGIIKEYEISYLQKTVKIPKKNEKNIFEKIKAWSIR